MNFITKLKFFCRLEFQRHEDHKLTITLFIIHGFTIVRFEMSTMTFNKKIFHNMVSELVWILI